MMTGKKLTRLIFVKNQNCNLSVPWDWRSKPIEVSLDDKELSL